MSLESLGALQWHLGKPLRATKIKIGVPAHKNEGGTLGASALSECIAAGLCQ